MIPSPVSRKPLYGLCAGVGALLLATVTLLYTYCGFYGLFADPEPRELRIAAPHWRSALPVGTPTFNLQAFPEKIWQFWKDDSEDSIEGTMGASRYWRAKNANYRYESLTYANSDAYVREHFSPYISEIFVNVTDSVLKAEYLKYLVMLKEGGVWADVDVRPQEPISEWIPDQYESQTNLVLGLQTPHPREGISPGPPFGVGITPFLMVAKPNQPAMSQLVRHVSRRIELILRSDRPKKNFTSDEVAWMTGAVAFTEILTEYFSRSTGVEHTGDALAGLEKPQLIDDILILPRSFFGWSTQEEEIHAKADQTTLVGHLSGES